MIKSIPAYNTQVEPTALPQDFWRILCPYVPIRLSDVYRDSQTSPTDLRWLSTLPVFGTIVRTNNYPADVNIVITFLR